MNALTTSPGAALGSDSDTLPPKLTLVQFGETPMECRAPELDLSQVMARLIGVAMAVTAGGHYIASVEYHGAVNSVSVDTHRADETCNGPSASWHRLYLDCIGDTISVDEARTTLDTMVEHLESLLEATP